MMRMLLLVAMALLVSGSALANKDVVDPFADLPDDQRTIRHAGAAALGAPDALLAAAQAAGLGRDDPIVVTTLCHALGLDTTWRPGSDSFEIDPNTPSPIQVTVGSGAAAGTWCYLGPGGLPCARLRDVARVWDRDGRALVRGAAVKLSVLKDDVHLRSFGLRPAAGGFGVWSAARPEGAREHVLFAPVDLREPRPGLQAIYSLILAEPSIGAVRPGLDLGDGSLWVHSNVLGESLGVRVGFTRSQAEVVVYQPSVEDEPAYRLKLNLVGFMREDRLYLPSRVAADWFAVTLTVGDVVVQPDPRVVGDDGPGETVDVSDIAVLIRDTQFVPARRLADRLGHEIRLVKSYVPIQVAADWLRVPLAARIDGEEFTARPTPPAFERGELPAFHDVHEHAAMLGGTVYIQVLAAGEAVGLAVDPTRAWSGSIAVLECEGRPLAVGLREPEPAGGEERPAPATVRRTSGGGGGWGAAPLRSLSFGGFHCYLDGGCPLYLCHD